LQTTGVPKATYTKSDKWDATDIPTYSGTSYPARYAIVSLYYDLSNPGGPRVQNLFLRQGGFADYVMHPHDAINSGGMNNPAGPGARPAAVRFSPYNLTAANLNVQAGLNGAGPNPCMPVDFPSQTGAIFQWGNATNVRFAYDNYSTGLPYSATTASGFWTDASNNPVLSATHETCPAPYRRPNDGVTNAFVTTALATAANSEIRQSLWLDPPSGTAASVSENMVTGYYADGFFDRRTISPSGSRLYIVADGGPDVAARGRLYYNPVATSQNYRSSNFLPFGGYRRAGIAFNHMGIGIQGYIWSATKAAANAPWLLVESSTSYMSNSGAANGDAFSIRCVRPGPAPELIDGIISDPWSGGDTDTKDQWVNW